MSVTEAAKGAGAVGIRHRSSLLLALFCLVGLVWAGWAWATDRRYKSAMQSIEAEILGGRYAIACRKLNELLSWKTDTSGGIVYLLGSCELARGRNQAASEAWARVIPGADYSDRAIRGRMRLFHDSGQFAAAEEFINTAALDPRNDRTALLVLLVPALSDQGRIDDAARLIENRWQHLNARGEGALEPAIKLVLQHVDLTLKPTPIPTVRAALDRAAKLAPDDDRVWLGRANLAIRTGEYAEAERWLDACQRRRPVDLSVWRSRLDWGMATQRVKIVEEALTHLRAKDSSAARVHERNAWLAAQRGDAATERRQLELLVEAGPADVRALERLAALATNDGQPARAAELRAQKAEIDRLRARYLKLHERKQPIRNAVELAGLAEQLGRPFEARVFRAIAQSEARAR